MIGDAVSRLFLHCSYGDRERLMSWISAHAVLATNKKWRVEDLGININPVDARVGLFLIGRTPERNARQGNKKSCR